MLKKILIAIPLALIALAAILAVAIAMQPSTYKVERTAVFNAPPASVFDYVNDFHKWDAWSPWAKLDPNAKVHFEGASSGTGAIFRWAGNNEIGEGSMTILESQPSERIKLKLEFIKPFPGHSDTVFTFTPQEDKTQVTWTMTGQNDLVGKAMCLIMDMDKVVGGSFDEGLANMKTVVERANKR